MITKVQGKMLAEGLILARAPRLSALEKGMLKWAVVDPEDKVLDANIGSGMMAEYLRRNMLCELCGVSDRMEDVRLARARLQNCDIIYAAQGDIPWREDAFDTVLMKLGGESQDMLCRMLTEAKRVLKPGGQLVMGAMCFPASVRWRGGEERSYFRLKPVRALLARLSYEKISWQRTGLYTGVVIAWKAQKSQVEQMRKEI